MKSTNVKTLILALVAGLVLLTGCTATKTVKTAATPVEDTSWMFHDIVDAKFVKAHMSVPMPDNVMIVDARPYKVKYTKGHIPGAISIPFSKFDKKTNLLPKDKNALLIYYCGGLKCRLSHKSAKKAEALGYKTVKVFAKGYPEWKKTYGQSNETVQVKAGEVEGAIELERFKSIIAKNPESILLIDVRDADEFAKGSFKTAINIPVEELEPKIKDFPDNKPIVYVCPTGARSGEAYYMTRDVRKSLKDVYYVEAEIDFKSDGTIEIKKPK
ncbi:MAG: rhodanese-like domain-containing protein [Deltaproteobacteria bacterium]|nr:rhodanese-like domain-containing protein [Deltaproteobacteria bacterium]